jgi:hypothetical protein
VVATGKWRKGVGAGRLRYGSETPVRGCFGLSAGPGVSSQGSRKGCQDLEKPRMPRKTRPISNANI